MPRRFLLVLACTAAFWPASVSAQAPASTPSASDEVRHALEFQKLLQQYVSLPAAPREASAIPAWRDQLEADLDKLIGELSSLAQRAGNPPDVLLVQALSHARRANLLLERRRVLDVEYARLIQGTSDRDVARSHPDLVQRRADMAEKVAIEYRTVQEVLTRALKAAEELGGRREMSLITGVVLAQSAIVQDRAIDSIEDAGRKSNIDPKVLSDLLDQAEGLLTDYVNNTPRENGLEWVRGQYYLGVVQYRRSLKVREPGKPYYTEVSDEPERRAAFEKAKQTFQSLADPKVVLDILQPSGGREEAKRAFEASSFNRVSRYSVEAVANFYAATANVYLGLIAAIDPQYTGQPATVRLEAARVYMELAKDYDYQPPAEGEERVSLSSDTIPISYAKVMGELEAATKIPERKPLNDFAISIGTAALYDTNVTLQGRNTEAPLDKRRKRDFRVPTAFRLSYIADLDVLKPGDPLLKKWQLYAEGRVNSTWNARIHDFNEQFYGGTINLRYEVLGPGQVANLDALYLHARYDYDHIMLGNDGFLRINRLRPMLQAVAFDGVLDASAFFTYEDRNYLEVLADERFDRDGNYYSGGLDFRLDLGKWVDADKLWGKNAWGCAAPQADDSDWRRPLEYRIGVEFTSNSTVGDEFDYNSGILTTGLTFPLPWGMDFSTSAVFEWQDYWQHSLVDYQRRERRDFIQEYAFRLERRFYLSDYPADFENSRPLCPERAVLTLYGDIRFSMDDSNVRDRLGQSIFEYNRVLYSAGVRFDLN